MSDTRHFKASSTPPAPSIPAKWWALPGTDGRTYRARRFRDLCLAFAAEIGGELTPLNVDLIRRAAALALRAETLQIKIVAGEDVNDDAVVKANSEGRRILEAIRARPAAPGETVSPLARVLAEHHNLKDAEDGEI